MSLIEEILNLDKRMSEESESHLHQKANLSKELNDLSSKEKKLAEQIILYQKRINSNNAESTFNLDMNEL
ncbi:MAG: hypothetical protein ACW964_11580, partial [Candidatus Hodarchaeales archaeon]